MMPIVTAISVIVGYYTLQNSGELNAFFTLGVKHKILAIPCLLVALIVTLIAFCLSFYMKPLCVNLFKENLLEINKSIDGNFFEKGKINTITNNLKIYVGSKNSYGLSDIFIIEVTKPRDIIFADYAKLYISNEGYLMIQLNNAQKHFITKENTLASIRFNLLDVKIKNLFDINHTSNLETLNIKDLWQKANSAILKNELASRIIWPLYNIIIALSIATLLLWNCNIKRKNVILTLIAVGFILITYFICLQLASSNMNFIKYRFVNLAFLSCLFSYFLVKR
jgi:lipopolysaccharide export LptBFGC system permease protein LptF